jgi:hypothetical protein
MQHYTPYERQAEEEQRRRRFWRRPRFWLFLVLAIPFTPVLLAASICSILVHALELWLLVSLVAWVLENLFALYLALLILCVLGQVVYALCERRGSEPQPRDGDF